MSRLLRSVAVVGALALSAPAAAFAHEAPESAQSRWVMVDWMLESFFVSPALRWSRSSAWKAGHFISSARPQSRS